MNHDNLLIDAANRIFADLCDKALLDAAEQGEFAAQLWSTLQQNGFHELGMRDSGATLADVYAVIRLSGRYALPLPLAEILLANRWIGSSARLATIGLMAGDRVVGAPWGRRADLVLGIDAQRQGYVLLERGGNAAENANLAGEPRDELEVPSGAEWIALTEPAFACLSLARVVAMAGCLERVLELCLQYANEREQFGRAIGKFQAIQHGLAVMAGEVAAASRAADAAVDALGGDRFVLEVAAAKSRVGEAAGLVAESAHQIHGAMGYTHEHQLHHFTRRVWAWRDEYGNEAFWQQHLGRHLTALGAERLWDFLATRG
jgi:acyl-CoA dehydrogenase